MSKDKLKAYGIGVCYCGDRDEDEQAWRGVVSFYSLETCPKSDFIEGSINTKKGSLSLIVDVLKKKAEGMGIIFHGDGHIGNFIYYDDDFESRPPPEGYQELLEREVKRIGWPRDDDDLDETIEQPSNAPTLTSKEEARSKGELHTDFISVWYDTRNSPDTGWRGKVIFSSHSYAHGDKAASDTVIGEIITECRNSLPDTIDAIKTKAEGMGVIFDEGSKIFYDGDYSLIPGCSAPSGWGTFLNHEADRIGWPRSQDYTTAQASPIPLVSKEEAKERVQTISGNDWGKVSSATGKLNNQIEELIETLTKIDNHKPVHTCETKEDYEARIKRKKKQAKKDKKANKRAKKQAKLIKGVAKGLNFASSDQLEDFIRHIRWPDVYGFEDQG